jgi:hypothetical protein
MLLTNRLSRIRDAILRVKVPYGQLGAGGARHRFVERQSVWPNFELRTVVARTGHL